MPSPRHDTINQLFRDRPALVAEILHDLLGVDLPTDTLVRLESNDFNDRPSTDFQPDGVYTVGPPRQPVHGIIVEVQQAPVESKRRQLPRYAAALWLMLRCRVTVLCICPDAETAAYYAASISTELPGYVLRCLVLGPRQVPVIREPAEVEKQPELATLSVMMHGQDRQVAETFVSGLALLRRDDATHYYEYAYSMAGSAAKRILEGIMSSTTWPVYSPFAKEHFGRGKAEGLAEGEARGEARGEAKAILRVLAARHIQVSEDARERILECADLRQLEVWLDRAVEAKAVEELFA